MVSWCSWLSRQSNTLKVSSSSLDEIITAFLLPSTQSFLSVPGSSLICWLCLVFALNEAILRHEQVSWGLSEMERRPRDRAGCYSRIGCRHFFEASMTARTRGDSADKGSREGEEREGEVSERKNGSMGVPRLLNYFSFVADDSSPDRHRRGWVHKISASGCRSFPCVTQCLLALFVSYDLRLSRVGSMIC